MRSLRLLCLASVLSIGGYADTLYSNLDITSGQGSVVIGSSPDGTVFNSFSTGSLSETLTGLELTLIRPGVAMDPITVTLYTDGGSTSGNPISLAAGSAVSLGSLDDNLIGNTAAIYSVTLPATPVLLAADTRYWIALSGVATTEWVVASSPTGTGVPGETAEFWAVGNNPVNANANSFPLQMQVTASPAGVPESSTLLPLMGLIGMIGLVVNRKAKRS